MRAWAGTGEAYAASYAALCAGTHEAVLAAIGTGGGRSAVDVGSGTGALATALAGHGWDAVGCEPEPTMRAVARREHSGIRFLDAALPHLPFAARTAGVVVANFVLNHVPDPRASATEMARVTAEDGILVATTWVVSPSWFWLDVCRIAGIEPAAGERLPPEKDFERTGHGFAAMLADGGWSDVTTSELSWTWHADPSRLWASAEGGVASAGAFYRSLDADDRRAFRRGFDAVCAERAIGGGVPLDHTAVMAVGGVNRGIRAP